MSTLVEPQHMVALGRANRVRVANAEIKEQIGALSNREGAALVAALLRDPADPAGSIRVGWLLLAVDKFGEVALWRAMRCAEITSRDRKVRTLTVRQRHALAAAMGRYSARSDKDGLSVFDRKRRG